MALSVLPIDAFLPEIVAATQRGPAAILVAEPGAGKTTRVPRALLDAGLGEAGEILVLEPRRIAARASAKRVADELGESVGQTIGYSVRFDDVSSARTRVRFITEGLLTRRLIQDPSLNGVSVVVLDELHERSLHADLALAMLRRLQRGARPDLRLVAMSATIDAEPFAEFLGGTILRVPGRQFDVRIEYAESDDDRPLERRVAAAVRRASQDEGHILIFLPGAAEIRRAAEALAATAESQNALVLPLHGDLPPAEQDRALAPTSQRKIILATNVAETSLTIDGVGVVIDSGLARVAKHSPWSGLPTLELSPISQASARQRSGRAGRTREGVAYRLYTKRDHDLRPAHELPEIRRVDLTETVLSLHHAGISDLDSFPFFEPPGKSAIEAANQLLSMLGALDESGITELGRQLLRLPLHPRLARVVLETIRYGLEERGVLVAALLAERDLRLAMRTRFGRGEHLSRHESGVSDVLARLEAFEEMEAGGAVNASRLRAHELDVGGGLAVARARDQLKRTAARLSSPHAASDWAGLDEDSALQKALLTGFPDRVGKRRRANQPEIVMAGGGSARLAENSVVRDAELVLAIDAEERRGDVEIRTASAIEPEWLLETPWVEDIDEIRFDANRERIEAVSAIRYLGLPIDESKRDAAGAPGAARVLAKAALAVGLGRFADADALVQLERRLEAAHRIDPSIPQFSQEWLEGVLEEVCEGRRSFEELARADLLAWIIAKLGHGTLVNLDRIAPAHIALPGRKNVPVHYEVDRPPWIESRMQDFCGLREGPRALGQALVLHLLAPNQRAVQVTTDLAGFWVRHYPALRKELMRRYPRHQWPDDPTQPLPPRPPRTPRS